MITDDFFYGTKHYHKKFDELCDPLKKYLGITVASYKHIDQNNGLETASTNYKWVEKCIEEKYFLHDPGIVHPQNMSSGFTFVTTSGDQEYKDSLLKAAHQFGFHHGFCYAEKTGSSFTLFYFATHKDNNKIVNAIVNEGNLVKKLIRSLYKEIISNFKSLPEHKIDPFELKGNLFLEQKGIVFNGTQENNNRIEILKNQGFIAGNHDKLESVNLTRQEVKCLRVYMEDSNIKQVARTLNIALTTATSYVENIKQKLSCNTKQELLSIAAVLMGLGKL